MAKTLILKPCKKFRELFGALYKGEFVSYLLAVASFENLVVRQFYYCL